MWLSNLFELLRLSSLRQKLQKCSFNGNSIHVGNYFSILLKQSSDLHCVTLGGGNLLNGSIASLHGGLISIGENSDMLKGSAIRSALEVKIGKNVIIGRNVIIQDNNSHPTNPHDRMIIRQTPHGSQERLWINSDRTSVVIEDNCLIGNNARICKGVTLGKGCIVTAGSVVTKSFDSYSILSGNPAKSIGQYSPLP